MRSKFAFLALAAGLMAAPAQAELKKGTPAIKSISAIAFGPAGVLFVGDPQSAAVFAIDTGDAKPAGTGPVNVDKIDEKAAGMLGITAGDLIVNDVKVNPASGNVYLAVTRGKGTGAVPVVLKLDRAGKIDVLELKDVPFAQSDIKNAAAGKQQQLTITSLGYLDGKVIVAGLSNEEFASTLRAIKYPFEGSGTSTNVEIFHGAHGKLETRSPVQTFIPLKVGDKEELLAAYTCTPLVRFPVDDLKPGQKVRGTTIAELGNGNKPLDMIAYSKDGKEYILMSNTVRGVMKIPAAGFASAAPITEPLKRGGPSGVKYETVSALKGVMQLDKLDAERALILVKAESGELNLKTIALP